MKTGRAGRILGAGLVVLGGTAALLWACGEAGRIHGTVTESVNGQALLPYAILTLERTADQTYVACACTDGTGAYEFPGLTPDGYTVWAGHMFYQPETVNVTVGTGADVTQNFVLDPIPANIQADVIGVDQSNAGGREASAG